MRSLPYTASRAGRAAFARCDEGVPATGAPSSRRRVSIHSRRPLHSQPSTPSWRTSPLRSFSSRSNSGRHAIGCPPPEAVGPYRRTPTHQPKGEPSVAAASASARSRSSSGANGWSRLCWRFSGRSRSAITAGSTVHGSPPPSPSRRARSAIQADSTASSSARCVRVLTRRIRMPSRPARRLPRARRSVDPIAFPCGAGGCDCGAWRCRPCGSGRCRRTADAVPPSPGRSPRAPGRPSR
jgi:hypothetical protein